MTTATITASPRVDREQRFRELYKDTFPDLARYIARKGGTLEEAKDVFHDALIGYYEQVVVGNTALQQSPRQYLFGIARHLWHQRFRQQQPVTTLTPAMEQTLKELEEEKPLPQRIRNFLVKTGKRCAELLTAFYYHRQNMTAIAEDLDYSSPHSAAAQKYKCLEKMRTEAAKRQWTYADFTD